MRKIVCFLLVLFTISSCKKADEFTQFDLEYTTSITIPSSFGINLPIDILTPDVETNAESTFEINDTRKDLIEEITLTTLTLSITSPSNGNFGCLKSIEIYIGADGLSETKIAWKDPVPDSSDKILVLETTTTDLKEYIKADQFTLRVYTVTDEALSSDYDIDVYTKFFVDAKVLGQ